MKTNLPVKKLVVITLIAFFILSGFLSNVYSQTTWTGSVNTDWNNIGNWTAGVPDASDAVTIDDVTNDPVISTPGSVAKSVTVNPNGMLSITINGKLAIDNAPGNGLTINFLGTCQNDGEIAIGVSSVTNSWIGLFNQGSFTNGASGHLFIDRFSYKGLSNQSGTNSLWPATFINAGTINMLNTGGSNYGLLLEGNYSTFTNLGSGLIEVYGVTTTPIGVGFGSATDVGSLFNNHGGIKVASSGIEINQGITCWFGTFNHISGLIQIDGSSFGVNLNGSGVFNNSSAVTFGATLPVTFRLINGVANSFNNNTGGVVKGSGIIQESPFINNGGILQPGIPIGEIIFDNSENFSLSTIKIDVNGTTAGTFDKIVILSGEATLGGNLELSFNYTPSNGDLITILDATTITGIFTVSPPLPVGWTLGYNSPNAGKVSLQYSAGIAPQITCPQNITQNNTPGQCGANVSFAATATGTPVPTITYSHEPGSFFPVGTTTVTATATNTAGSSPCTFTVTVADNETPAITCPSNISVIATGDEGAAVTYIAPVGTDNCPDPITVLTAGLPSGSTFPIGTTTNAYTVTDGAGNTASCSFTVTATGVAPQITCPANITVNNTPGQCSATVSYTATETVGIPASTITYSIAPGSVFELGTTTVTATATNTAGTSSCTFTVTVNDTQPPAISCAADVTVNSDQGSCGANVTLTPPTATENCGSIPTALGFSGLNNVQAPSSATTPVGSSPRTYEAWIRTTSAGLRNTFLAYGPEVNGNLLKTSNGVVKYGLLTGTIVVNDGNWHHVAVTGDGTTIKIYVDGNFDVSGAGTMNTPNDLAFRIGVDRPIGQGNNVAFIGDIDEVRIWNVVRTETQIQAKMNIELGPQAGLVRIYHFNEGIPLGNNTLLPSVALDASGNGVNGTIGGTFLKTGSVSNWVTGAVSGLLITSNAPVTFQTGTTTVTWTATDAAGNTASCDQMVTVIDSQLPVITCPGNISVIATSAAGAAVTFTAPVGTDNCPGAATIQTSGLVSGSTFPIGATTNAYTVTDAAGNSTSCSFTVTVTGVAPLITCPADITVNNTSGQCGATVMYAATETTGVPASTITYSITPGSFFLVGTATVTATATNAIGTSICTFTVGVTDNEAPVANVAILPLITAECSASVSAPTATDNCAGSVTGTTTDPTSYIAQGTYTITWTYDDGNGNTSTQIQTVIIDDVTPPTIACAAEVTINNTPGLCTGTTVLTAPTVGDNCASPGNALNFDGVNDRVQLSSSGFPFGNASRTIEAWVKTTSSGTVFSYGQNPGFFAPAIYLIINPNGKLSVYSGSAASFVHGNIIVNDGQWHHIAFTYINVINTMTIYIDGNFDASRVQAVAGLPGIGTSPGAGLASIGCKIPYNNGSISGYLNGTVDEVRVWNIAKTQAQIQATMNQTISAQAGLVRYFKLDQGVAGGNNAGLITALDASGNSMNGTLHNLALNGSTSNWTGGSVGGLLVSNNAPASFPKGTTSVTWTANDGNGNTATCSQNVTVVDNEAPAITCPGNISVIAESAAGAVVTFTAPIGTDNCPGATTVQTSGLTSGATFPAGTTTNAYTVTDGAGYTASCSFTITVTETGVAPQIICPANITVNNTPGLCGANVTFAATATGSPTPTITYSPLSGSVFPVGTTTVTATALNVMGSSPCTFTVTVLDNEAPAANVEYLPEITGECSASVTAPTATDNCAGSVTGTTTDPTSYTAHGIYTITWTYVDGNSNTSAQIQTVIIDDITPPSITCTADVTINNTPGLCSGTTILTSPTASDNCASPGNALNLDGVNDRVALSSFGLPFGNASRTIEAWVKTTAAGTIFSYGANPAQGAPAIYLTIDDNGKTYVASGSAYSFVQGNAVVNDGQWHHIAMTYVDTTYAMTIYVDGVFDASRIQVKPGTFGINTIPGGGYLASIGSNVPTNTGVIVNYFTGTIDEVRVWNIAKTQAQIQASMNYEIGVQTGLVRYYKFDQGIANGNNAGLTTANDASGNSSNGTLNNFTLNGSTSNWTGGSVASLLVSNDAPATFPKGTTTVTWTANDGNGNTATCTQNVIVVDNELPVIACPGYIGVAPTSEAGATVTYAVPVGTDNCPGAVTVLTAGFPSGSIFPVGATTVTYKVTDAAGNTAQCSFIVEVNSLTPTTTVNGIVGNGQTVCYNAVQTITVAGNGTTYSIEDGGHVTMIAGHNILYLPGTRIKLNGYLHGYITTDNQYCGQMAPSLPSIATGDGEQPEMNLNQPTFAIYPNPTSGDFTLEQKSQKAFEHVKVAIYGMFGEKVMTGELTGGEMKHVYQTSGLPAGLYFVNVAADGYVQTFKLVKTK